MQPKTTIDFTELDVQRILSDHLRSIYGEDKYIYSSDSLLKSNNPNTNVIFTFTLDSCVTNQLKIADLIDYIDKGSHTTYRSSLLKKFLNINFKLDDPITDLLTKSYDELKKMSISNRYGRTTHSFLLECFREIVPNLGSFKICKEPKN
jgi:hypothetical protein